MYLYLYKSNKEFINISLVLTNKSKKDCLFSSFIISTKLKIVYFLLLL